MREELWKESQIIFSTPQGLENDIISKKIKLEDVSLLGVDEAHRAVKEYSYVWIAKEYMKSARYPRILGLTASPGNDKETISEVCTNLHIEDIELRTQDDPDVKPYVKEIDLKFLSVDLPPSFIEAKSYLEKCYRSKLDEVKKLGFVRGYLSSRMSKKDLLSIQAGLMGELTKGNKDFAVLKSVSLVAEAMKVSHGQELLESQGIHSLYAYLNKLISQARTSKVKAVQNLVNDPNFKSALIKVERMVEEGIEHPKFRKLREIVQSTLNDESQKMIIFTQFRDTALKISEELKKVKNADPRIFVGQQKKGETGLSQKEQIEMLSQFREGKFNVIIMTSVGEEGLDIPKVDRVVFFEPVPSAIRHIQRRGRTGRQEKGSVIVLVAKKTRDEAYRWSAKHKEGRMYSIIKDFKKDIYLKSAQQKKEQKGLGDFFSGKKISIYADYREKGLRIIKGLIDMGVDIKLDMLGCADYVLSRRVGVEYKTVEDFVNSIIDGRLLSQVRELKRNYDRPLVIIEGTQDIYSVRKIHPNAINGLISTIVVSYGVPLLYTKNTLESARMLWSIAKREQEETSSDFQLHTDKKARSIKEQQEYIVSSFPNIGPLAAKELLKKFKTVKKIVNAKGEKLKKVPKIGEKTAKNIREILDSEY